MPELHLFARVGSTNDVLRRRAAEHAPTGAVALAEQQTAGRGQHGRTWSAPPGSSLLMSVLLRPASHDALGTAPLRVGLAVAAAILDVTGLSPRIKWPNDLLIENRKLGGVLCEAATTAAGVSIVAGIGVNCTQSTRQFPPEIAAHATSLRTAGAHDIQRGRLAGAILQALGWVAERIADPLTTSELEAFAARDALKGQAITIDGEAAGTAAGITATGALRVRTGDAIRSVHSGSVRSASAPEVAHERAQ